jgi:hypothetical protein
MKHKNTQKGTIGIMSALVAGTFILSMASAYALTSLTSLSKGNTTRSGVRTFQTAESAALEGAYQYIGAAIDDAAYSGGEAQLLNSSESSGIEVEKNWPSEWPYVYVSASSTDGVTTREINRKITVFAEGEAFDYAVFADNSLNAGGSSEINGNVFANNSIDLSGSSDVNGNAYTPGDIDGEEHADEVSTTTVLTIPPPNIESGPYYSAAVSGGTYFDNDNDAENYLKNKTLEAFVFSDDTDEITNVQGTTLTGFLYTTGDLKLSSGGTYTASDDFAAIICEGDLEISGGVTINGVVYVKGSTSFGSGNNTINGSLISVGNVSATDITGNVTINYVPMPWQYIEGLGTTTSAVAPRVLEWGEE